MKKFVQILQDIISMYLAWLLTNKHQTVRSSTREVEQHLFAALGRETD